MRWYHYTKILISGLFIFAATLYFLNLILPWMESNNEHLSNGASLATIVGGIVGIVTLVFIWMQLYVQNVQTRLSKTYEFSAKLQNPVFLRHLSIALVYFKDESISEDEKWDGYINNYLPKTAIHVYITLAWFEDISMLYNGNYISKRLIKKLLKTMIIDYYNSSQWFRRRMKETQGKSMYKEWDKMYEAITVPWWNFLVGTWESVELAYQNK